jgi:hypothetical protein
MEQPQSSAGKQVMGVRIVNECRSNVIPLYRTEILVEPSLAYTLLTEPTQLYGLTVLTFLLHTPTLWGRHCVRCGTAWPCDHLRLAFRLRAGF